MNRLKSILIRTNRITLMISQYDFFYSIATYDKNQTEEEKIHNMIMTFF